MLYALIKSFITIYIFLLVIGIIIFISLFYFVFLYFDPHSKKGHLKPFLR